MSHERERVRGRIRHWRGVRLVGLGVALVVMAATPVRHVGAQVVSITGAAAIATTPTPVLTIRANGVGLARPLRFTLQVSTSIAFNGSTVYDSTIVSNDSVIVVQLERLLPSGPTVYVKARVQPPVGATVEAPIIGPFAVATWLTLLSPNSPDGNTLDPRRPTFVWRSAPIAPSLGPWTYVVEITSQGQAEQSATGLTDTTWTAENDLQTSASYRWRVRASLNNGTTIVVNSATSFLIKDQLLPSSTLLYQNFPNPFPSPTAFATCIWFDVAEPGARVSLQVTDLRGNLVRTLIPGPDGQRDFAAGRYGQGASGTGSSCDNRFVWNGTGDDGRSVAAGVYLLRFQAGRNAPTFRRMLFRGR